MYDNDYKFLQQILSDIYQNCTPKIILTKNGVEFVYDDNINELINVIQNILIDRTYHLNNYRLNVNDRNYYLNEVINNTDQISKSIEEFDKCLKIKE